MSILLVIVLLFSGATTYVAQTALPGDVLYQAKLDINKQVSALFKFGAKAEAKLQDRLSEINFRLHLDDYSKRLKDAPSTAADKDFSSLQTSDQDEGEVNKAINLHAENKPEMLNYIREDGGAEITKTSSTTIETEDVHVETHVEVRANSGGNVIRSHK